MQQWLTQLLNFFHWRGVELQWQWNGFNTRLRIHIWQAEWCVDNMTIIFLLACASQNGDLNVCSLHIHCLTPALSVKWLEMHNNSRIFAFAAWSVYESTLNGLDHINFLFEAWNTDFSHFIGIIVCLCGLLLRSFRQMLWQRLLPSNLMSEVNYQQRESEDAPISWSSACRKSARPAW